MTRFGLKKLAFAPLILARHGSLNPKTITLPGRNNRISVNAADGRAYKKLIMDTARGRVSTPARFWHDHVAKISPGICLDIGSNYGECMAFGRYGENTRCIAIEANPTLRPYLDATRQAHLDASRITIESCLLGLEDKTVATLHFNDKWTGGGSGVRNALHNTSASIETRSADSILKQYKIPSDTALIFKMDVEGFEGKVIDGFTSLLQRSTVAGSLEFSTTMLSAAGTNPADLFNLLAGRFSIYQAGKGRNLRHIPSWEKLVAHYQNGDFHCDLAVFSRDDLIADGWTRSSL